MRMRISHPFQQPHAMSAVECIPFSVQQCYNAQGTTEISEQRDVRDKETLQVNTQR